MAVARLVTDHGRAGLASSVCGGQAFIFGGHDGSKPLKTVASFQPGEDPKEDSWNEMPPMLARRTYATACELEGKIYVVGGSADGRTLSSFEALKPATSIKTTDYIETQIESELQVLDPFNSSWAQWFTKPPMAVKRTMHGAAVAEGKLYVSGGFDGVRDLSSAEFYDPRRGRKQLRRAAVFAWKMSVWRSDAWSSIDSMSVRRSYHVMAAVKGNVYAIGGWESVLVASCPRQVRSDK